MDQVKPGQQYVTKAAAARILGCARKTLYDWIGQKMFTVVYLDERNQKKPRLLVAEVMRHREGQKAS